MSRSQVLGVSTTVLLSAIDGFDVLAVTFAAPGITAAWGISKVELGLTLSSGLVGMALGSLFLAPVGDRTGRRPISLICLSLMAAGMFLSAGARAVEELALWRLITGVGIGALVPTIVPLATEYANAKRRRLAMALMALGYPVGGSIGGLGAAILLQRYDWTAVFILGGALSLAVIVPVLFWLHESPQFLLARQPPGALRTFNRYLIRCGQEPIDNMPPPYRAKARGSTYLAIFSKAHRSRTITVTLANLLFVMSVYYMLSWMPQLTADLGFSASFSTAVSAVAASAGALACLLLGMLANRIALTVLTGVLMNGLGLSAIMFGMTGPNSIALLLMAGMVGAFLYSGIWALYSVIIDTFSPEVRVTGTGFVMGVGRAAGAISPALAGLLFSVGAEREVVTTVLASAAFVAAWLIFLGQRKNAFAVTRP